MQCPFCHAEMLHGYLNCGMALWSERKHKLSLLPDGKEKYALRTSMPLLMNHVESYCCPKCRKIIVDAAEYPNNLD